MEGVVAAAAVDAVPAVVPVVVPLGFVAAAEERFAAAAVVVAGA